MQIGELWVKIGGRDEALKATLAGVEGKLQGVGNNLTKIGGDLTKKITLPVVGATTAVGALVASFGWGRLKAMDAAQAQLKGLGYDLEEVERISGQVKTAVRGTTMTMAEGTSVAAGALAAGVKEGAELEKYIRQVGDAAVGSKRPIEDMAMIFNRVQGSGKLMTQELNSIEQGMPGFAQAMADSLGVTQAEFRKMVSEGKVSSEQFLAVMDDFAGEMSEAYAKSWEGMVSNTKAWIGIIGETILKGAFEQSKASVGEFMEYLKSDDVQKWAAETGKKVGEAFSKLTVKVKDAIKWWSGLSDTSKKLIVTLVGIAVAAGPVLTITGKMLALVPTIMTAIKGISAAMAFLAANPIGALIAAIGLLVIAGVKLYQNWDTVKAYSLQAWSNMKVGILKVISSIMSAMETLYGWIPKIGTSVKAAAAAAREALAEETVKMQAAKEAWQEMKFGATSGADFRRLDEESRQSTASIGDLGVALDNATLSFDGMGTSAANSGGTVKKVAEDIKAAWEVAADRLKTSLSIIKTSFGITENQLDMTGTKTDQLRGKIEALRAQMEVQKQIIDETNIGYEQMVIEKGENSEEAEKLKLKLLEEQKALSDLEKQLHETTSALEDHSKEFRDLASEIEVVEKKYREDLTKALEDYQRNVEEINRKLADDEQKLTDSYNKSLEDRARSLRDFVGLFDEVSNKEVSGATLLSNLQGQVDAFENWSDNIQTLAAKGVDEGLIDELRQMGPKAGPEIAALNTLTDEQLDEYVTLWRRKNQDARIEATNQLQQQKSEMQTKLQEIRATAADELERYRKEWEKKNDEIRKNTDEELTKIQEKFEALAKNSTNFGQQFVMGFVGGMESKFDALRKAAEEMASIVSSGVTGPLEIRSPSKLMHRYGGEIINGLMEGLRSKIQPLGNLVNSMAMMTPVALGSATSNTNNYGGNNITIYIQGDSTRDQADNLLRELAKRGVRI